MYIPGKDDDEALDGIDPEDLEIDDEDVDPDDEPWIEEDDEDEDEDEDDDEEGEEEDNGPEDLAAAFKRVQGMDKENPEDSVDDRGEDSEGDSDDQDGEENPEDEDGDVDDDRGSSALPREVDYAAVKRGLIENLNKSAVAKAAKEFRDAKIREFQMNDLYERTSDGRVIYHNPDDPNRPFSSRMEAQSWIDSFNGQVRNELKRRALEIRNEDAGSILPSLRLMDFAPSYDAMDDAVREMFDDLIEGYEVLDSNGNVVGYNCDLDKMASKAERLASSFSKAKPSKRRTKATKPTNEGTRQPSLDMKSHGSGGNGKMKREPQTLEEAMLRLRQQNK